MTKREILDVIRDTTHKRRYSNYDIATLAHVSINTVGGILAGRNNNPTLGTLLRIAHALKLELNIRTAEWRKIGKKARGEE